MRADRTPPAAGPGASLHVTIREALESRILGGDWPPGHRIPAEHELMGLFGCSRMTVNKVLTELAANGLVERRRRAGTFVSKPRPASALLQIPDVKAEILALGARYTFRLVERAVRAALPSDRARLAPGGTGEVLGVTTLHVGDERPFALEDRVIDLVTVPDARDEPFRLDPPGTWLLAHIPWTEAEHRIGAAAADGATAALLDLAPQAPCLVLERRTWAGGAAVTAARTLFADPAYRLVARFQPGSARPEGASHKNGA
ncbi:histidine utilization repressor [Aurantimonas sp. Leaf443]|uniref:histidine utilization repressor n=1 Tax=Aurantimonas sp. Leaf443 TaxID=1736378 RepID=UPI0006F49520|nr:histidine utilization repressor [Aurantimonas sp. Leaf443]KQT85156.1 hypothetical protein ASG48_07730 [Aurantimonas sp. Leaf443]